MTWTSDFFLNPKGLYALFILVPFILLYLIKPRPKKIIIPSLMFFIKDKDQSNINSFLQKFVNDFLFFLQLAALVLLAATIAKPFIVVPSISYAESMVFVIDASASMNAIEDGSTRFDKAIDIAKQHVQGRNTIILATDRSQLVLENAPSQDTEEMLETLKCKGTKSLNFYDSIVLAANFAGTENAGVFVLSDFSTEKVEKEFMRAKLYLESKGIDVFFEDVSKNKAQNIGIIDLDVKELQTTVWIKNFNDKTETFTMTYGDKKQTITLGAKDVTSYTLTTLLGTSKIEIDANDDFPIDNNAYISTPSEGSLNVLLMTNGEEKYLTTALGVMENIKLDTQKPPIVTVGNPNIIILGNIDKNVLIPGDIAKVKKLVEEGAGLIILGQDNILGLNLGDDLFPFSLYKNDAITMQDYLTLTQPNSYITPSEIQFGQVRKLYETAIKDGHGVTVYANTTKNKYPIIAFYPYGKGKVMYYGIFDDYSDFKADIFYPIFWKRSIDLLTGGKTIGELNKNTGYLQIVSREQKIKTPSGEKTGKSITMDDPGFYEFKEYTIAANILSEEEQRLNRDKLSEEQSSLKIESEKIQKETRKKDLSYIMIMIITGLLIIEFLYVKLRGDM